MKTKKGEVIFCVGLIIVLINAVSSELLTDAFAISLLPYYPDTEDVDGVGQTLRPLIINPDYEFNLMMFVDNRGDDIQRIRFESASAASDYPEMENELWKGVPGIEVHRGVGEQHTLHKCSFEGFEIDIQPKSGTEHSLLRLQLKFFDAVLQRFLGIKVMVIEKPKTQEDLRKAEDYDLYDCPTFKSFDELMSRMKYRQILVNLEDDFPWILDVLERAKNLGRPLHGGFQNSEWYYAGGIMVKPGIIPSILRLDPRWAHHIPKELKTDSSTINNNKPLNAILSCLGINDTE